MNKDRIETLKTVLRKEAGSYLYKQNRASAFNTFLETTNSVYYSFHKRNEMIFEGLKKSISDEIKAKIKDSNKLHIIFIHEPMDVPREDIYENHVVKRGIKDTESAILVDILPGRRGEVPENQIILAYWSMRDIANEYSAAMSFIYHIITDMHSTVQVHTDSTVYHGDVIIDFDYGFFLTKKIRSSYKAELKYKYDWPALRTVLNDRFSGVDSISSDPLANAGAFKACADDFFLLMRVTIIDKYTKFLRQDSINTKKRIDSITAQIRKAELGLITDEADKELDEMNDIMNTRMVEVGEHEN